MAKRPKLNISYSVFEKILEVLAALGIIVNIVLLVKYIPMLSNNIPVHFDAAGNPNRWSGKGDIIVLFIQVIVFYILFTVLSRFPHIYNYIVEITEKNASAQYHNARKLINTMKVEIIYVFTYIQWSSIYVDLGKWKGLGYSFGLITMLIIFATLAYYIIRSIQLDKE